MKKLVISILSCLLLFNGCKKDEEIEPMNINLSLTIVESGNVGVHLVDNNSSPLSGVNVRLNKSSSYSGSQTLEEKRTNESGDVVFEKILQGDYYIYIKEISINNNIYTVSQNIQVISSESKVFTINPQDYVGDLNINFSGSTSANGAQVVLFRATDYTNLGYSPKFEDIKSIAFTTGTVGTDGKVSFTNVPATIALGYMIFTSTQKYVNTNSISVSRGETYNTYASVYWTSL